MEGSGSSLSLLSISALSLAGRAAQGGLRCVHEPFPFFAKRATSQSLLGRFGTVRLSERCNMGAAWKRSRGERRSLFPQIWCRLPGAGLRTGQDDNSEVLHGTASVTPTAPSLIGAGFGDAGLARLVVRSPLDSWRPN